MNRTDLIDAIAFDADISKAAAQRASSRFGSGMKAH
jgi:nucleoid DNA-binding protein